jgi:cytoskeletal protein RodZ
MKTIGQTLKNARESKKYSLKRLEDLTKIKRVFIDAIERESWSELPPFPTVLGFVKSIAAAVAVDEKTAVAVLKRDYPPKKEAISPKPDISSKFVWGPKLTFAIGVAIVLTLISAYLVFQYSKFISPPTLNVLEPKDGAMVGEKFVLVQGTTDTDSQVTVNNQPVITDQDGRFSVELEITLETQEVVIKAVSRSGKETVVSRRIEVK